MSAAHGVAKSNFNNSIKSKTEFTSFQGHLKMLESQRVDDPLDLRASLCLFPQFTSPLMTARSSSGVHSNTTTRISPGALRLSLKFVLFGSFAVFFRAFPKRKNCAPLYKMPAAITPGSIQS